MGKSQKYARNKSIDVLLKGCVYELFDSSRNYIATTLYKNGYISVKFAIFIFGYNKAEFLLLLMLYKIPIKEYSKAEIHNILRTTPL